MTSLVIRRLRYVLTPIGAILVLLSVGATRLGLDPNQSWGPARRTLLAVGIGLLLTAALIWSDRLLLRVLKRVSNVRVWVALKVFLNRHFRKRLQDGGRLLNAGIMRIDHFRGIGVHQPLNRVSKWLGKQSVFGGLFGSRSRKAVLFSALAWLLVEAAYVWTVSLGRWTDWPGTTRYYDMLAEAFQHGQLSLSIEPDPRLATLPDPYNPDARKAIPVLPDASYYRGRYYLYWGPAPAVVIAAVRDLVPISVGEPEIVFVGVSLASLFGALILGWTWHTFFRDTYWWIVPLACIGFGLMNPLPWLLSRPAIYEAAIAAGQSFLMGGVFFLLPVLADSPSSKPRLALASLFFGLAITSRATLILPVLVLLAFGGWRLIKKQARVDSRRLQIAPRLTALGLPLILILGALAWYNLARFGSPAEFGQRYTLASANLNSQAVHAFSLRYIPVNLYNYLFTPLRRLPVFPFVKPVWGRSAIPHLGFDAGSKCFNLQVTGLLVSTPFSWLAFLPALVLFVATSLTGSFRRQWLWTGAALGGATAAAFLPFFSYCASTMNYLVDAAPMAMLFASICAWDALTRARSTNVRLLLSALILSTLLATSAIGFLLGVTGYEARFEKLNPQLFDRITRFLSR